MRNVEFIEGGKNGEFDFILEKCSCRSKSKEPYGNVIRFYRFHEDYVGFIEIQYIAFFYYKYHLVIALPWCDDIVKMMYLQKEDLKKNAITYRTSFSPIYTGKEEEVS